MTQTSEAIEVTRTQTDGESYRNKFALDGTPGDFVTVAGVHGKGRAQWKGKYLLIESTVTASVHGSAPMTFHMTEHWQPSPDGTLLTIKTDLDCPGQQEICGMAFPDFPTTEKFKKEQQP